MFVVDTNVLVYVANANCPEHARCRSLLEQWRRQTGVWYVTWSVLYGFLRIVTHPRVLPQPWTPPEAWKFLQALLASPTLEILVETDRHAEVLGNVLADVPQLGGNLMADVQIATLMREHGVRTIYTRDTDFHRFRFLEIRDPLANGTD